jgi:hypothetical protein
MKPYTLKIERPTLEALNEILVNIITEFAAQTADDKLVMATTKALQLRLAERLIKNQIAFTLKLAETETIALYIILHDYCDASGTSYMANWCRQTLWELAKIVN